MDSLSRRQVPDGQAKLDNTQERALKIIIALSEHYQWQKNGRARQKATESHSGNGAIGAGIRRMHNRAQEYLNEIRESESSKTAGSYNP